MKPPILKSSVNIPKVLWFQTDDRVVLRIMLPGVEEYSLRVDMDHLRFSTIHLERNYYLCLYFFGAVIPEKTFHKNQGREIRIELPKAHRFLKWLRLELKPQKTPQITMDLDRIDETIWRPKRIVQNEWDDFAEYKRKNNLNVLPVCPSSDSDSSDDERFHLLHD